MNVKPGDLAIIIKDPYCGGADIGKIVKVVCAGVYSLKWGQEWQCEGRELVDSQGIRDSWVDIPDSFLRPIRPGDLEDETPESIIKELSCEHQ